MTICSQERKQISRIRVFISQWEMKDLVTHRIRNTVVSKNYLWVWLFLFRLFFTFIGSLFSFLLSASFHPFIHFLYRPSCSGSNLKGSGGISPASTGLPVHHRADTDTSTPTGYSPFSFQGILRNVLLEVASYALCSNHTHPYPCTPTCGGPNIDILCSLASYPNCNHRHRMPKIKS